MRKRTLIPVLAVLAVFVALGVALWMRAKAPPEAARLLPESDAILYINLKPLRAATRFDQTAVKRSPEFQHFVDVTGIVPERDLDAAAFALHHMPDPNGPNGPVAYSEVFVGRFNGARLQAYLESLATSREVYAGHVVYTFPIDGRTLRVARLGYDMVAVSNMPTPEQIHSMLDRAEASALATPGSSLLKARFRDVPLLSQAWGIGRIGLPFAKDGHISMLGMELPLPADTQLVASLRYSGNLQLRVEEFAGSAAAAQRTVQTMRTLVSVLQGVASAQTDPSRAAGAVRGILDSVQLKQEDRHAELTAAATADQVKALTADHGPAADSPAAASPATPGASY